MINEEFEWDDAKAASNLEKHGVSFGEARLVFQDPFAVELYDDRRDYGEDRYILIGMSAARLLVIAYTKREDRFRIISARRAEPNERRDYYTFNT